MCDTIFIRRLKFSKTSTTLVANFFDMVTSFHNGNRIITLTTGIIASQKSTEQSFSMIYHLILLAGMAALATSIEMSAYNVIARPRNLQSWEDVLQDERNISFDGSVADIQALALEKAQALANDNKGPPEDLAKPVTCDGTLTQSVLSLRFQYSVEYDPNYDASQQQSTTVNSEKSSNLEEIIETIEHEVQNRLSRALLTCKVDDVEVQAARVVGLVRTPRDEALNDSKSCHTF